MTKFGKYSALAAFVFVFSYFGAMAGSKVEIRWAGNAEIGTVDFITIVLSALSVMLVILTIFLAVMAFVGISAINDRLEDHSRDYFNKNLKKGKPAFEMVQQVVRETLYRGVDSIDSVEDEEDGEAENEDG